GQGQSFFQFFAELMQGFEMIGGSRNFILRSLQELLVATVDQLGNLAANQVSRIRENLYAVIPVFLDSRRDVVLLQEHAPLHSRRFDQIETVIAQPADRLVIAS